MTQQQFDNTQWGKGMKSLYMEEDYWIRSVDFRERLLGLVPGFLEIDEAGEDDNISWVRCENCELMK